MITTHTMSASSDITVMGPAPTSSYSSNPPQFITNVTNMEQYRDGLETWVDIMRSFVKVYSKSAVKLDTIVLIIYLADDDEAKAKLRAEESENCLSLKGTINYRQRTKFVGHFIKTIDHETWKEYNEKSLCLTTCTSAPGKKTKQHNPSYTK